MEPSCLDGGPWVITLPLGSSGGWGASMPPLTNACASMLLDGFVHMLVPEGLHGCGLAMPLCVHIAHPVCACCVYPEA